MTSSVLYQEILVRVRELKDEIAEHILSGGMTHDIYCGAAGRLRGVLDCEALIVQAWKDMFEERKIEPPGVGGVSHETIGDGGAEVEPKFY